MRGQLKKVPAEGGQLVTLTALNFGATSAMGILDYNPAYGTVQTINNTIIFSPRQIQLGARFHF